MNCQQYILKQKKSIFIWDEEMSGKNQFTPNPKQEILVFGLNLNGNIVQFNHECQKLTGFARSEVINKKIWDVLSPTSSQHEWKKVIHSLKNNLDVEDIHIPWKTKYGDKLEISWKNLPLEQKNGAITNICLIGTRVYMEIKKNRTSKATRSSQSTKYQFEKPLQTSKNDTYLDDKEPANTQNKLWGDTDQKHYPHQSLLNKITTNTSTKLMNHKITELSKKYDTLTEKLKELEKKDRKLERKNKLLEKNLKTFKKQKNANELKKSRKSTKTLPQPLEKTEKYSFTVFSKFKLAPFKSKKKQQEFTQQMVLLDNRQKQLDTCEKQLLRDRKNFDKKISEFSAWKEKLLSLEAEIEKRRQDLVDQEEVFRSQVIQQPKSVFNFKGTEDYSDDESDYNNETQPPDHHNILDKIPQGAAIIQRSLVKQVNTSFLELLGFQQHEIIDKSLFDFIAPEGLSEIEQYYLNRLKGNGSSSYGTILSTKQEDKIMVEVSIKPTLYNGEKAEIVVIQEKVFSEINDEPSDHLSPEAQPPEEIVIKEHESVPDTTEDVNTPLPTSDVTPENPHDETDQPVQPDESIDENSDESKELSTDPSVQEDTSIQQSKDEQESGETQNDQDVQNEEQTDDIADKSDTETEQENNQNSPDSGTEIAKAEEPAENIDQEINKDEQQKEISIEEKQEPQEDTDTDTPDTKDEVDDASPDVKEKPKETSESTTEE